MDHYYQWSSPCWDIRGSGHRVFISCDIDEPLTVLVDELSRRLQILRESRVNGPYSEDGGAPPEGWDPTNGTLVLVIRGCHSWDNFDGFFDSNRVQVVDRHKVLVMGGLAFVEGLHEGVNIGDSDPTYCIEQVCLAFAHKDYDHSVFDLDVHLADAFKEKAKVEETRSQIEELARPLLQGYLDENQIATFLLDVFLKDTHPEDLVSYVESQAAEVLEKEATRKLVLAKARKILRDHLNEDQLAEFDERGEFHVLGADGFLYLITDRLQHNIFRIEGGRRTFEYCIVVSGCLPIYDQMLAQMLLLQTNPSMFHETANTWSLTEDGKRMRLGL